MYFVVMRDTLNRAKKMHANLSENLTEKPWLCIVTVPVLPRPSKGQK